MQRKKPWLALLLSVFIPGVGQIYIGKVGLGIFILVFWLICAGITFIFIPWAVVDFLIAVTAGGMAYSGAKRVNREIDRFTERDSWSKGG